MSWIALDDVVAVGMHALTNETLHGPANVVAPRPVTNLEFTKALGRALGRPTIFPMPAFAARLAFGEMADVLSSQRVEPARLHDTKYSFRFPDISAALQHILK
jgi:NAD dependent epimerase/dehydratase family enzyme